MGLVDRGSPLFLAFASHLYESTRAHRNQAASGLRARTLCSNVAVSLPENSPRRRANGLRSTVSYSASARWLSIGGDPPYDLQPMERAKVRSLAVAGQIRPGSRAVLAAVALS